ncbi:MAG TPA: carbohydrate porin, partial [Polyangiaceae bacterium]
MAPIARRETARGWAASQACRARFVSLVALTSVLGLAGTASAKSPRDLPSEDKPSPPVRPEEGESEWYSFHFQLTAATQYHPSFFAKYSGQNSLSPNAESATAFVSTVYTDVRLWRGAELLFDPELSGGSGVSHALGIAAFPDGIVYRVGDPAPAVYLARLAISQSFGLGGGKVITLSNSNELAGTRDKNQLAITVGRLAVTDVFDANRWANDATSRFFNWALFASGAWDYPADTRGYTYGALSDLTMNWWSARVGIALEPKYANLADMEWNLAKSRGLMAEYEARYKIRGRPGAWSLLLFHNTARMGNYAEAADAHVSIGSTREDGRTKYGFALSVEQQFTHGLGAFLRISANDGANESWAFTEIDRSLAFGVVQDGELWHRDKDEAGIGTVINGLSAQHRRYLAGGGYGFIIGDGALNYAPEVVTDIYYR